MISIDSSNAFTGAEAFGLPSDDSALAVLSTQKDALTANSRSATSILRVEAESMALEGYRIEQIEFASGGAVASFADAEKGERGSASFEFSGEAGVYDVVLGFFDEEGGGARLDPLLNGQSLGALKLDQKLGSNFAAPETFVRRSIGSDITLQTGDTFAVQGFEEANEHARLDYVEFIRVDDTQQTNPQQINTLLPESPTAEYTDLGEPATAQGTLPDPVRINVGGEEYTDRAGQIWIADQYFEDGKTARTDERIWNTPDDPIYQTERYAGTMDYHIPVANGIYTVELHFAEIYWSASDKRTFDIEIEGEGKGDRVDIYKETGKNKAIQKTFTSILVTDGLLDLHLGAVKNAAKLSGIEVSAQALLNPTLPAPQALLNAEAAAIRVNSGGEQYTDREGNVWLADTYFDDGWTSSRNNSIQGTPDDPLYQSERYARTLDYSVPVANGTYSVNLLFAETYWSDAGKRIFDVSVEGRSVAENLDLYQEVGKFQAFNQTINNVTVTDGTLDIALDSDENYAKLSGFEIVPVEEASQAPPILPSTPPTTPPPAPSGATPLNNGASVRYISPNGGGDGSSWQQAASITNLDRLIEQSAPGDEIWIAGDLGTYDVSRQIINIDSGSDSSAPIYIRGVASQQGGNDTPLFVGDRAENWAPGQTNGSEVFRLLNGANHLHFSGLNFKNIGNGAFRLGGDITGITLQDMEANNVRRFVENFVSGGANTASVTDLTIKDIDVRGFSKGAIRLQYNSNNILIEDVFGDAEGQDGDNFTMGVQLKGSVHDVVHRNVTMNNAIQTKGDSEYWNADGFVTDWGTYNITYEDTFAAGSTDGGYDLKSENTTLIRAGAADNKRNFRVWRTATFIDVKSDEPFRRGGTGTTAHIHVLGNEGNAIVQGGTFSGDQGIENIIFDLDDKGSLTLDGATITDNNYVLKTVGQGNISLKNLEESNPSP
ncbi:MAG: malectin domain-containing carbohydrate-binding protein [Phormidesmis sp.]